MYLLHSWPARGQYPPHCENTKFMRDAITDIDDDGDSQSMRGAITANDDDDDDDDHHHHHHHHHHHDWSYCHGIHYAQVCM